MTNNPTLSILLCGSPYQGFLVFGPFHNAADALNHLDGVDRWDWDVSDAPLTPQSNTRSAKQWRRLKGTAIVFDGNLNAPFRFFGPFENVEAAADFAAKHKLGEHSVMVLTQANDALQRAGELGILTAPGEDAA